MAALGKNEQRVRIPQAVQVENREIEASGHGGIHQSVPSHGVAAAFSPRSPLTRRARAGQPWEIMPPKGVEPRQGRRRVIAPMIPGRRP